MHWSYFNGQYKIMSCNRRGPLFHNSNNFLGLSANLFGQLKYSNFYKRQTNMNNINALNKFNGSLNHNIRSRSLNNKFILNTKNPTPLSNKKNYNFNNNINNNISNNNEINKSIEQKTNKDIKKDNFIKINGQKSNSNEEINIENNNQFNYTMKKDIKIDLLNKDFIKTNFSIPKPLMGNKQNKSKPKINNNDFQLNKIYKNENINNGNKNFISTKYGFNKNKIKNENLKFKMSKSSSSFYN